MLQKLNNVDSFFDNLSTKRYIEISKKSLFFLTNISKENKFLSFRILLSLSTTCVCLFYIKGHYSLFYIFNKHFQKHYCHLFVETLSKTKKGTTFSIKV